MRRVQRAGAIEFMESAVHFRPEISVVKRRRPFHTPFGFAPIHERRPVNAGLQAARLAVIGELGELAEVAGQTS